MKARQHPDMSSPGYFISQSLAGNNSNFLTYPLVGVKVVGKSCIVLLNNDPGGFLNCLRSHPPLGKKKGMVPKPRLPRAPAKPP